MTACACIIETRPLPNLDAIIEAHAKFIPKDWDIRLIDKEPINSPNDYNKLLTSKRFWRNMPDYVLIFQHDSEILRTGIEEFLQYDYVGAPWKFQSYGGNGGLSLRNSKTMLNIINHAPYGPSAGNEDVYFCNEMFRRGMNLAQREICSAFSVESIMHLGSWGAHAIDSYLSANECKLIREQYKNWKL